MSTAKLITLQDVLSSRFAGQIHKFAVGLTTKRFDEITDSAGSNGKHQCECFWTRLRGWLYVAARNPAPVFLGSDLCLTLTPVLGCLACLLRCQVSSPS
jgi:hypothetical protein